MSQKVFEPDRVCPRSHRLRYLFFQLLARRRAARSVNAMSSRKGPSTDFVNPGEHWLPPESTSRSTRGATPWRYRTAEAEEKAASADESDDTHTGRTPCSS